MREQWRAHFDAVVTFSNGGELSAKDFRLDIPGETITEAALGELFVAHLGLLMVDQVQIGGLRLLREAHRGSRGVPAESGAATGGVVELSHPIHDGMVTYPGLPGPQITDHLSRASSSATYAPGTQFQIGRISMVANTGTYLDTPFHRFEEGADLATFPLSRMVNLPGVVVQLADGGKQAIDRPALAPHDVRGRAVLLHTGWDRHWGTDSYGSTEHPFLTGPGAEWLVEQGAALVGIDSVNIDDVTDLARPAHSTLLAAGIPIVEHLCGLDALPATGFRFHAAPPRIEGMGTFPVRAYAIPGGRLTVLPS